MVSLCQLIGKTIAFVSLLLPVLASLLCLIRNAESASKKPNVIFMMVDDWGWANVGYRDTPTKDIITPNIDALVKQGLQLDQHYVYNWCSPSHSALLTGRVPIHVNEDSCEICYNPKDPVYLVT